MRRILAAAVATLGLLGGPAAAAAATADDPAAQALGQAATAGQNAGALSGASQSGPSNYNVSVRVLSPGNDGDVKQSNTVGSTATATNANVTGQSADQTQSGTCGCDGGTQAIGQTADSDQSAGALSLAHQSGASNVNVPVRVLSPGDGGDVEQSNTVDSAATAANANATGQTAEQAGGSGTQAIGQQAKSEQDALAASAAKQDGASNTNVAVRVLSKGDDGDVTQKNTVESSATALNLNATEQDAEQAGRGDCKCGSGLQAIGQEAKSDQDAHALSAAHQSGARNENTPVRVGSYGGGGDVDQRNSVESSAAAGNLNLTGQSAGQSGAGGGTQAIGQKADSDQSAGALSLAGQSFGHDRCGCAAAGNSNTPVSVGGHGRGGDVDQSNEVDSSATAVNLNGTKQDAAQHAAGDCRCGSGGVQALGQQAKSDQDALALSAALQHGAANANESVDVGGDHKGHKGKGRRGGGDVDQSNEVDSSATALNLNGTKQHAEQEQRGDCGCHGLAIQALGQSASNEQGALAASLAAQAGASNENASVGGGGGDVDQSNEVDSSATAANLNGLHQEAAQAQSGGGGLAIQALGQEAKNEQAAIGLSAALQLGASNANSGVGGHGDVEQSNHVGSNAGAANANATAQRAAQRQAACGCKGGVGVQALGQSAKSRQHGLAASLAAQLGGKGRSKRHNAVPMRMLVR